MATEKVVLTNRELELKANAYTFIIYEDEFKGRNFLRDFNNVLGVIEGEEPETSNHIRFLWALAKTANPQTEDFKQFAQSVGVDDVLLIVSTIVNLINESLGVTQGNLKATDK